MKPRRRRAPRCRSASTAPVEIRQAEQVGHGLGHPPGGQVLAAQQVGDHRPHPRARRTDRRPHRRRERRRGLSWPHRQRQAWARCSVTTGRDLGQLDHLAGGRSPVIVPRRARRRSPRSAAAGGRRPRRGRRHLQRRCPWRPAACPAGACAPPLACGPLWRSSAWRLRSAAVSRDGGLPEFPEFWPTCRSSSATRASSRSFICRSDSMVSACAATNASSSAMRAS